MNRTFLLRVAVVALCLNAASFADDRLDVCDVSFLWPVPQTKADAKKVITATEQLTQGGHALLPPDVFDQVIEGAQQVQINHSGQIIEIDFHDDGLKELENWKVAGIRIDPSAPGCSGRIRDQFGSMPQIRLILQPVLVNGEKAITPDFAMHVGYSYVTNQSPPFKADRGRFAAIVKQLVEIKRKLKSNSIDTTGAKLGVHPGFSSEAVDLTQLIRSFLKSHLTRDCLTTVAFMGIQSRSEPWVFFFTRPNAVTGKFELAGSSAQMLSFVTSNVVVPKPTNRQFHTSDGAVGVATDLLFSVGSRDKLLFPAATEAPLKDVKVRHIPDIVANPQLSHVFNTDCVSCHTESALRHLELEGAITQFAYRLPEGVSGVEPAVLPTDNWNIRNFGWGFSAINRMIPTVTMRTANEAAESAHFINEHYLSSLEQSDRPSELQPRATTMVANPLTLVMKCKSDDDYAQLEGKIKGLLAREDNPIKAALDEIGTVHFARFVFFEETKQIAVITSYDHEFERYITRFVEKIGDVFNLILEHVEGAESMRNPDGKVRVQDHSEEFLRFVQNRDLKAVEPFYSAYPDLSVQKIRKLERDAEQATE